MQRLIPWILMAAAFALSAAAHKAVDEARAADRSFERVYIPSGEALRTTSMGYHTVLADIMWVRAVLSFADIFSEARPEDAQWLSAMLDSVATLDPLWRTTYYHGGGMLRVVGDINGSDALFERGMEALPEEPYFPFSIAMNAYLHRKDQDRAAAYLDMAAGLPGAPAWYRSAAAGFINKTGQRQAALRYLKEQQEQSNDPAVRRSLEQKMRALMHEEHSEALTARYTQLREELQRAPQLAELGALPEDPHGAGWVISAEGDVVSEVVESSRSVRALRTERTLVTDRTLWRQP